MRPLAALLTTLTLAATGALGALPPAHAASQPITDATFVWGLSGYAQEGVFGAWTFADLDVSATRLVGSVSGGSQSEYVVAPAPATSMPAGRGTPNAIKLIGGTGTADPATGAASLAWSGSYTVNSYPAAYNAPDEIYSDPRLTIAPDGSGSLSMAVSLGAGQDIDGDPVPAKSLGRLTLVTFTGGSESATGSDSFRYSPDYQGVEVTASGQPQDRGCSGTWGSWAPGFVTAVPESVRPHFYSTGCGGKQDHKPPLPIDVDLGLSGQAPSGVSVTAPSRRFGQSATVTVAVPGGHGTVALTSGSFVLGRATLAGGSATIALGRPASGSYPVTATYYGSGALKPGTATGTLSIAQATSRTTVKVARAKATITVTSPTATPTGRATLKVLRGSRTVKQFSTKLAKGRGTVKLPRLGRGDYRLVAAYRGTADVRGSSKAIGYRVR